MKSTNFKVKKTDLILRASNKNVYIFMMSKNDSIKHFIYAQKYSEARYKYNQNSINAILSLYQISAKKYKFDCEEIIIEHFKFMSEIMYNNIQIEI